MTQTRIHYYIKHSITIVVLLLTILAASACEGEDRSGEQPFAPTVRTLAPIVDKHTVTMRGQVLSSPNSSITACGFLCGNDTLSLKLSADKAVEFSLTTDTLMPGHYYITAYATNGIGTTNGDTLYFDMPSVP